MNEYALEKYVADMCEANVPKPLPKGKQWDNNLNEPTYNTSLGEDEKDKYNFNFEYETTIIKNVANNIYTIFIFFNFFPKYIINRYNEIKTIPLVRIVKTIIIKIKNLYNNISFFELIVSSKANRKIQLSTNIVGWLYKNWYGWN